MNANKSRSQRTNPTNAARHRMRQEMLLLKKKKNSCKALNSMYSGNEQNKQGISCIVVLKFWRINQSKFNKDETLAVFIVLTEFVRKLYQGHSF